MRNMIDSPLSPLEEEEEGCNIASEEAHPQCGAR
jgi:hypothetical protein